MKHSEETILKACLNQLYAEHERICRRFKLQLKKPKIIIADLDNVLGKYNPKTNSISFARSLILLHSWHIVLEILRHQCSHQYVFEVMRRPMSETLTHGDAFQEACGILRVHPDYRGKKGILPRFLRTNDPEELKLMDKVNKLLALAQSSNQHEAALALEKAQLLIYRYNLDIIKQDNAQRHDCLVISSGKKRADIWFNMIGSLLQDHFFVNVILLSVYDQAVMKEFACMELIGTDTNLSMAEYVCNFLLTKIDSLWKEYKKESGRGKGNQLDQKSFKYGIMVGFREKMEQSQKSYSDLTLTSKDIVASDHELQNFINDRYPDLKSSRRRSVTISAAAFESGKEQGKRINLHKPVSETSEYKGNLLMA